MVSERDKTEIGCCDMCGLIIAVWQDLLKATIPLSVVDSIIRSLQRFYTVLTSFTRYVNLQRLRIYRVVFRVDDFLITFEKVVWLGRNFSNLFETCFVKIGQNFTWSPDLQKFKPKNKYVTAFQIFQVFIPTFFNFRRAEIESFHQAFYYLELRKKHTFVIFLICLCSIKFQ